MPQPGRQLGRDPGAHPLFDLVRVLVGDEPERDLRVRLGRDDRLLARPGVAAPDAVHLGGRPGADSLERRVPGFAPRGGGRRIAQPRRLVEGQRRHQLAFALGQRQHPVVEAGDRHVVVRVVQRGAQPRHLGRGVGYATAERPGVQVDVGSVHVDLRVHEAAHADAHRRRVTVEDAGVAHHDDVAAQPLALAPQQRGKVRRSDLLLTLHDDLEVDAQLAVRRQRGLETEQVEQHLALVVDRAAGEELVAADRRLERRRLPQLERVDRLYVVVAVDHDGWAVVPDQPFCVHRRVSAVVRLPDLDSAEASPPEGLDRPLRAGPHVRRVRRLGRDRRDPQPLVQVVQQPLAVGFDVRAYLGHSAER